MNQSKEYAIFHLLRLADYHDAIAKMTEARMSCAVGGTANQALLDETRLHEKWRDACRYAVENMREGHCDGM
jgi:hypothetical protein